MVENLVGARVEDLVAKSLMDVLSQLDRTLIIHTMVMPSGVHVPLLAKVVMEQLQFYADKVCSFNLAAKIMFFLSLLVHTDIRGRLPF